MTSVREKAENFRDAGYSYNMIRSELNVPLSTLSGWLSHRPFTPNRKVIDRIKYGPIKAAAASHKARLERIADTKAAAIKEIGAISKRDLWMVGIGLYIGEGAKSIENVRIMNSDPAVIRLALRWFREICGLNNDQIAVNMFIYPDTSKGKAIAFWQDITGLPKKNFGKTIIDLRTNKRRHAKGKLPFGTIQLRVRANGDTTKGVVLFRRIMGWSDALLGHL